MQMRTIIVDDEPIALNGMKKYIENIKTIDLVAACEDPLDALDLLDKGDIDLMLLDIKMPQMTGFQLLRSLKNPPLVIITTAFPEYALDAFDLDVIDYIVKPISFQRLLKACYKVREYLSVRTNETNEHSDYFFIKCENRIEKISYADILYIEALNNYVSIKTLSRNYLSYLTFKSIEAHLPSNIFVKVHKSYIVSLPMIDSIYGNTIEIAKFQVPISKINKEEIMERILKNKMLKR